MHDDGGAPLPVQSRALSAWPDGSTRWLLVDTQVDLRPNQRTPPAGRARHRRVTPGATADGHRSGAEGIDVDTGALRFRVPRTRFALLDALHPAGEKRPFNGAVAAYSSPGERRGEAQQPTDVRVLEQGPLRTRIALTGTYGNGFDYEIRLDAYAGQPFVRILHTFINRHPTPFISVPRIAVELPLGELKPTHLPRRRRRRAACGATPIPDGGLHLVQRDNSDGRDRRQRRAAAARRLDRARRQRAPTSAWPRAGSGRSIRRASTCAATASSTISGRREADPANAGVGAAKTHEFAIWIAPPAPAAGRRRRGAHRAAGRRRRSAGDRRAAARCADALAPREPGDALHPQGRRRGPALPEAQRPGAVERLRPRCTAPSPASSACAPAPSACGTGATGTSAATRTRSRAPTAGATSSTTPPRCWR